MGYPFAIGAWGVKILVEFYDGTGVPTRPEILVVIFWSVIIVMGLVNIIRAVGYPRAAGFMAERDAQTKRLGEWEQQAATRKMAAQRSLLEKNDPT